MIDFNNKGLITKGTHLSKEISNEFRFLIFIAKNYFLIQCDKIESIFKKPFPAITK